MPEYCSSICTYDLNSGMKINRYMVVSIVALLSSNTIFAEDTSVDLEFHTGFLKTPTYTLLYPFWRTI